MWFQIKLRPFLSNITIHMCLLRPKSAIRRISFHPAKFDNFKDEKMSDYKTVSVAQSKKNCWTENFQAYPIMSNF